MSQSHYCHQPKDTQTNTQGQDTHAHTHRSEGPPAGETRWKGCVGLGAEAGAEEDAVPPQLNTVKFYSNHILTSSSKCRIQFQFDHMFLDSQCMGE